MAEAATAARFLARLAVQASAKKACGRGGVCRLRMGGQGTAVCVLGRPCSSRRGCYCAEPSLPGESWDHWESTARGANLDAWPGSGATTAACKGGRLPCAELH